MKKTTTDEANSQAHDAQAANGDQAAPAPFDLGRAAAIATLKRALKQLEDGGKVSLDEGGYAVDITIGVKGDLTVNAATPEGPEQRVPDFKPEELLAAICAGFSRNKLKDRLDAGVKLIADSRRGNVEAAREFNGIAAAVDELVPGIARRRNVIRTFSRKARPGSVHGKPSVVISGKVNDQPVTVDVT